jgi:hypothetical protein
VGLGVYVRCLLTIPRCVSLIDLSLQVEKLSALFRREIDGFHATLVRDRSLNAVRDR